MYKPFIVSKRFYLRGIEEKDLTGNMANWANDSEITHYMIMGCLPNSGPIYCSWMSPQEEYERLRKSKHDVIFAIIHKESDEMIGIAGIYEINWIVRHGELRIVIGEKKFLSKGIGTEVVKEIVKYGFEKLNLHKIYVGVNASDKRANKCYQKAIFVYEGTIRDYHYRNGKYYNANLYSILKDEFYHNRKKKHKRSK